MKPLIAANWKMHGNLEWANKPAEFNSFFAQEQRSAIEVLICPPFPFIAAVSAIAAANGIAVGAQTSDSRAGGAFTGQVNAAMAKSAGAQYIIAGHSERRSMGESNADVKAQLISILEQGLTPILCVGESLSTRESGQANNFVAAQLKACLPENLANGTEVVIAYEPIWAIGTGKVASLDDIRTTHAAIRRLIGPTHRILYGGSVKPTNAKDIFTIDNVNGALVGGASLEMESFAAIATAAL